MNNIQILKMNGKKIKARIVKQRLKLQQPLETRLEKDPGTEELSVEISGSRDQTQGGNMATALNIGEVTEAPI